MSQINVITPKCRQCYSCIQICPAKAIKREKGLIKIIHERCILCGSCIKICPQEALNYVSSVDRLREFFVSKNKIVACLDPAFPAVLDIGTPRQLVTSLRKLGFTEVWEGAWGAELVSRVYKDKLTTDHSQTLISSFCPAITSYIQKYMPQVIPNLAPIVSPMIAVGRVVRKLKGPDWKVVYITSCLAQMGEINDPQVADAIDLVISFLELRDLMVEAGIDRAKQEESNFDGPHPYLARIIPVIGGLYRSMGQSFDVLMDEVSATGGRYRTLRALSQFVAGHIDAKFLDLVFCEGCVDGPFVDREISVLGRRQIVARFTKSEMESQNPTDTTVELTKYKDIDLSRSFENLEQKLPIPTEEEINAILDKMNKRPPSHNLDCRACGYATCYEKAVAVAQGLAEIEMCLPYLLEGTKKIYQQLKRSHQQLQISHKELEQAQSHLIRTEKLASLGQLAAGVAHEINNPLGSITLFANLLYEKLDENSPFRDEVKLIIDEANRTRDIVQGLSRFSREIKIKPTSTNIHEILDDVVFLISSQTLFNRIKIERLYSDNLPKLVVDGAQMKQVFLNIILNAAQAMNGAGELFIKTEVNTQASEVNIKIRDTGPGIDEAVLQKVFDPFFTTKEKGTGLGLAISYGIIERHKGRINVDTEPGKGSEFVIALPICNDDTGINSNLDKQ